MIVRLKIGIVAACAALAAAACDSSSLFVTPLGIGVDAASGTGRVQGSVLAGGTGAGAVPVVLVGRDSTQTDANGVFSFDSIPAATYQLAVRVPIGFVLAAGQTATRTVAVTNGGTAGATFVLERTTTVP